jgi:hypothetical protein
MKPSSVFGRQLTILMPAGLFLLCCLLTRNLHSQELAISGISAELKTNANSILRYSSTSIEITDKYRMTEKYKWAVTVFNSSGNNDYTLAYDYNRNSSITRMEARVFDASGREIRRFRKNDIREASAVSNAVLFSDSRIRSFEFRPTTYPYTIEFSMERRSSNTAFIPGWLPLKNYEQGLQASSYELKYPENWDLRVSENLFGQYEVRREHRPGHYNVSAENIPAILNETHAPPFNTLVPAADMSLNHFQLEGYRGKADCWREFARWYYDHMLKGYDDIPSATKNDIDNIMLATGNDPLETARRIYEYVQSRTRYVAVTIGIGGWKPMSVESVDRMGYGECKALSFYTTALLRYAGLPAYYTIIHHNNTPRDIDSSRVFLRGNHVIVYLQLPETAIWLETTNQSLPFGYHGPGNDNRYVLSIYGDEAFIHKTPAYPDELNTEKVEAEVIMNSDGSFGATIKILTTGSLFGRKNNLLSLRSHQLDDMYKRRWSYLGGLIIDAADLKADRASIVFEENLEIRARSYGSISGNRMLVPVNFFNRSEYIPPRYSKRTHPLVIYRGYLDDDRLRLTIPEGYEIESLPAPVEIDNTFGTYRIWIEREDDRTLIINRNFLLISGMYEPENYGEYHQFRLNVSRLEQSNIVLTKTTL